MSIIQKALVCLVVLFSTKTNAQLWKQYADSAGTFQKQKNIDKAIEFFKKAVEELKIDSFETATYALMNHNVGKLYYDRYQDKETEPYYLEVRRVREKVLGKGHPDYIKSCRNLGYLYFEMEKYDKSEFYTMEAKSSAEKAFGKNHKEYDACCFDLGNLFWAIGQYEKAEFFYLESKRIIENVSGRKSLQYASICNNLANLYNDMGKFMSAESLYLDSKQIREDSLGKESTTYAVSCTNLATLYQEIGEYDKAESLCLESKRLYEKKLGKEHTYYASSCDNLGVFYMSIGQLTKAETFFLECKEIRERVLGKTDPAYGRVCENLGILYDEMLLYEKAEMMYEESQKIKEHLYGTESTLYAKGCSNLALLYYNMGRYETAKQLFIKAQSIFEKTLTKAHHYYASNCNNLGSVYLKMGNYSEAESLFLEGKVIREKVLGKIHPDYAQSCRNLADLYRVINKDKKVFEYYEEAFNTQYMFTKKVFQFTSESEKKKYFTSIYNLNNEILSAGIADNSGFKTGFIYNSTLVHRNIILASSQRVRRIINFSADSVTRNIYNSWIETREQLAFWATKPKEERNMRDSLLEEKANSHEKELTRLSYDFGEHQKEISWTRIQKSLKPGEAAIEFLEFQLYNGKRWTDSIYYVALVLRKDKSEPEMVKLFEKRQLDLIQTYKSTSAGQHQLTFIYTKHSKDLHDKSKSIYDLIWHPLEKKLTGIKTVYFAASGSLHKVAFATLPISDKMVLSDKFKLVQLSTTASVATKSPAGLSTIDKIILYGGIQYNADSTSIRKVVLKNTSTDVATRSLPEDLFRDGVSDFYYLAGSDKEVYTISKLAMKNNCTAELSTGLHATEESFKALTGRSTPAVLHIATHGFFFPDPKGNNKDERASGSVVFKQSDNPLIRSGLAFAGANNAWKGKPVTGVEDGILTAYEVSNMYLPNTKLAVLSACETGLGDIQGSEGVYGLQRAFKMAGVENLVMSLWKVPDEETAEFMQEFYKNLFAKQPISDAFYNAQTVMKNKYRKDPYKWAAWVLVR